MNDFDKNNDYEPEIDYRDLIAVLWLNKNFIIVITIFVAFLSIFYSLLLTNIYSVQTTLTPTVYSGSKLNSQYEGLASMAGINLTSGESKKNIHVALNLVKSKRLLESLMLYESFLPDLLAVKSWDMKTNIIKYDRSLYDKENTQWVRKVSLPFKKIPSSQEALMEFSQLVSISQDQKTQLVTLNVNHPSPVVAKQWSLWIVKEINTMLAEMEINQSQASIEYLNNQIKITSYSELRSMFYKLIQESTQSMMLAQVNPEYVLTTIDPPVIPEFKSYPIRSMFLILGALMGVMLASLVVFVRKYVFKQDDELDIFKLREMLLTNFRKK